MKITGMQLNLPAYDAKIRKNEGKGNDIFDTFRGKYVRLTPEEWVRQHFLHFLCNEKHYPASLIRVEKSLMINSMSRRFDAVIYKNDGSPVLLIEFKAPEVKLSQSVFDQVATYNLALHADYLIISNGLSHYCCKMDYEKYRYHFLQDVPDYADL
jgi:hypothetical protein